MEVTRFSDAAAYDAPGHFGMRALRLQGVDASDCQSFWVGLSIFLPAGGAEPGAGATEKVYIVLDGEVTIASDDGEFKLGPLDSCYLAPGESRSVENRANMPARMLVISAQRDAGA